MSMAQQTATPRPAFRPRARSLVLKPVTHPGRTLAKVGLLLAVTVLGAALMASAAALGCLLVLTTLGG